MKHKVLLIGLGNVGLGYDYSVTDRRVVLTHAKAFASHSSFELVAGVDSDEAARSRFHDRYGVWATSDLVQALRRSEPDVVVVATPTLHHPMALQEILRHAQPKLILCEKPLSYSLEAARTMVESCREKNCLLYVNYSRRTDPGVLEIKRRLVTGEITPPFQGVAWYTKGLLHNGSHFTNLLEFWLGPILRVSIVDPGNDDGGPDIQPDLTLFFKDAAVTLLAAKAKSFTHHEIQIVADNGCLRYERGGGKITWQPLEANPLFPNSIILSDNRRELETDTERLQLRVADCIDARLNGNETTLCSGEEALGTLETILHIRNEIEMRRGN